MYNLSSQVLSFYNKSIVLSRDEQNKLKGYRDTNLDRLKAKLEKENNPLPIETMSQGSYDMDTIIQNNNNNYDLDIGVVFHPEDLEDKFGDEYTPKEVKTMVCDAVYHQSFTRAPKVKDNCVRVYYNEGYHVDMPCYRLVTDGGNSRYELAAVESWIESDPRAVTKWFCDAVIEKSPDETNGRQMRRVVRYIKYWGQSRDHWDMPSGFIVSKLVDECYVPSSRDDESLLNTLQRIQKRLESNKDVYHPILTATLLTEGKEESMDEFQERISTTIKDLEKLNADDCTQQTAAKVWDRFFHTDNFTDQLKESNKSAFILNQTPTQPVQKYGEQRFG